MLSVIIPALNEEMTIEATLKSITGQNKQRGPAGQIEIIVVDGGSSDCTREIAARYARVIQTNPPTAEGLPTVTSGGQAGGRPVAQAGSQTGRAVQMNIGARYAAGEILLFLHADTILPGGALGKISEVLKKPGVIAGSFSLRFDSPHPFLRFLSFFTRFSWWWARYGDQGLFLYKKTFEALGGFREIPIMEDVDFIRRLKRRGGRLYIIKDPVVTSARRYRKKGVFRQHLLNCFLLGAYMSGVSPQRLRQWYDDVR